MLLVFSALLWILRIIQKDIFTYVWDTKCCLHIRCVALWGGEGPYEYWHGNCIWCPWLAKFRQLDSSLHKPFTFLFPISWERVGKYLCLAVDTSLTCDSICSSQSSQVKAGEEGGVLRGQGEWLKAAGWKLGSRNTSFRQGCAKQELHLIGLVHMLAVQVMVVPIAWNFAWSLAKNLYRVLKEKESCWSVINNFFFCVCVWELYKGISACGMHLLYIWKVNDASTLYHTGWPKGISLPVCVTPKEPCSSFGLV